MPLDLVYLSACETGTGELRRGEGLISLSRAFFYSGVRSLITTLWSVEDARSMELSERFYTHLQDGMTKDKALGASQREYLQNLPQTDKAFAHPVYWSALIPVGNMSALQIEAHGGSALQRFWILLLGIGLITLLIILFRRKVG